MFVNHGRFSGDGQYYKLGFSSIFVHANLPHSQGKYARNICVCCMDNNEHWTYMSSNAEKALILFWRKSEKARFWKWVAWRCTHAVGGGGWSASQYTADICRDTEWTKTHACSVVIVPSAWRRTAWLWPGRRVRISPHTHSCRQVVLHSCLHQIHSVYKVHAVN